MLIPSKARSYVKECFHWFKSYRDDPFQTFYPEQLGKVNINTPLMGGLSDDNARAFQSSPNWSKHLQNLHWFQIYPPLLSYDNARVSRSCDSQESFTICILKIPKKCIGIPRNPFESLWKHQMCPTLTSWHQVVNLHNDVPQEVPNWHPESWEIPRQSCPQWKDKSNILG